MKLRTYFFPPSNKMGSYSLKAKDNAQALLEYNEARKRNADHDGDDRPPALSSLPRGTYYVKEGESVNRRVRFPQVWEYETQGNYSGEWCMVSTDKTYAEAKRTAEAYRENDKGVSFRVAKVKAND